jgi:glycolate oxidase subunit GlcD
MSDGGVSLHARPRRFFIFGQSDMPPETPCVYGYNHFKPMSVSMPSISSELRSQLALIVGEKNVLSRPADLYLYSFDSALDRSLPAAVVLPETPEQVAQLVRVLSKSKHAFVARGAATSLCGGPVPLQNAVVIALARLNHIVRLDAAKQEVLVEPGVINLKLQDLANASGLFYGPDPGSQKACTLGGNVATNAGGPHCLKYGVTSQFVLGLEWIFPDGQTHQLNVNDPGYDVVGFLVGSEGTLGVASRIRLRLLPKPKAIRTMLVSFSSIEDAIQSVTDIIADGVLPATLEAMDKTTIAAVEAFSNAGYPLNAEAVLLIEVDGDSAVQLDGQVARIQKQCALNRSIEFRFAKDETERKKLWEGRRGAYPAMARLAPNVLVEDGAVPRTMLPEALKRIKAIAAEYNLRVALLFHAGDGNLHPQIVFDERNAEQTRRVKEAGMRMLKVCVDLGGTISGEHGIGIDKREAMKWLFTRETLTLFRRLKNAFDPENLCNPDKLIPLVGKSAAPAEPASEKDAPAVSADGIVSPASEAEMVEIVKRYAAQRTRFGVTGFRTKYLPNEPILVSTGGLSKVLEFDRSNFTLTVQSGVPVDAVRSAAEKEKRYLWLSGPGSFGGVIATKSSVAPAVRDLILGMRVLLPTGDIVSLGAKTMKNVAGYDAAKLLLGSWGTLGIILDVTFRLFPAPAPELRAMAPRPFVFKDLHRKIKKAFDPLDLLSMRTSELTEANIQAHPRGEPAKAPENTAEKTFQTYGDKFWL